MNDTNFINIVTPLQGLDFVVISVPGVSPRAGMFNPSRVKKKTITFN